MRRCENQITKSSQKKLQNTTINFPSYILRIHTLILLASFLRLLTFANCISRERLTLFLFHFLEIDIREQKKYEMRTQTSVDNTVTDLRVMKSSLKTVWKTKTTFLLSDTLLFFQQIYISFSETYFLKLKRI